MQELKKMKNVMNPSNLRVAFSFKMRVMMKVLDCMKKLNRNKNTIKKRKKKDNL